MKDLQGPEAEYDLEGIPMINQLSEMFDIKLQIFKNFFANQKKDY